MVVSEISINECLGFFKIDYSTLLEQTAFIVGYEREDDNSNYEFFITLYKFS